MTKFIPLGELIADYAKSRGLNARELAARCGAPATLVSCMLTGNASYSVAVRATAPLDKKIRVTFDASRKQFDAKQVQELTGLCSSTCQRALFALHSLQDGPLPSRPPKGVEVTGTTLDYLDAMHVGAFDQFLALLGGRWDLF